MSAPLLFVHGAGCTGDVFAAQLAAFEGSHAITLPGHGTPGTPGSIEEFADVVNEFCAERGLERVVLAGSSMGGAVALELALRRDPLVHAVVLLGSGAKLRVAPPIFEALRSDFRAAARMLAGYFFAEPDERLIDDAVAEMLRVGQEQTIRDFRACDAFDVTDRLGEIGVPLLAITGERDVMMPPKHAALVADRVPGASARILPGAGHLAMVERPADTNEALRAFVTQIDS